VFTRIKKSRHEEYLQIVENYRDGERVRQRLVMYVGHYASLDEALGRMPREVSRMRAHATRAAQFDNGRMQHAAEEAAAKLDALQRLLEENPEIKQRDRDRAERHAQRRKAAIARRSEARRKDAGH
jgi:hypothetical protein